MAAVPLQPPQLPSAASQASLAISLGGGIGEEHSVTSPEVPNYGRSRSQQRRTRGSLGSPSDVGSAAAGSSGSYAGGVHYFERTSVSLVRRTPSQRRPEEVEDDVAIDEEGLFV